MSSTWRVRCARAARVTKRSRSVPSSATRMAFAPRASAAAASFPSSGRGWMAWSQTPQCVKDTALWPKAARGGERRMIEPFSGRTPRLPPDRRLYHGSLAQRQLRKQLQRPRRVGAYDMPGQEAADAGLLVLLKTRGDVGGVARGGEGIDQRVRDRSEERRVGK